MTGYTLRSTVRMEWLKLRSVRSTWYLLAAFAAGLIGVALLVMSSQHWSQFDATARASFDPTNSMFTGLAFGQLLLGALGVLVVTAEFSSGMIRATFAAVPSRPLVLAAKACVLGGLTLLAGEIVAFASFFIGQLLLRAPAPHPALGQPGVLRAVVLAGAYPALIALIGLGLGAVIRHTAGAISSVFGLMFVLSIVIQVLPNTWRWDIMRFFPDAAGRVLSVTLPGQQNPHLWSTWPQFLVTVIWAVVLVGIGGYLFRKRDA